MQRKKKIMFFFTLCSLNLNVFLFQLPEVQCPQNLDFLNPWGKLMERSDLRIEYFFSGKGCKMAAQKKVCNFLVTVLQSASVERRFVSLLR